MKYPNINEINKKNNQNNKKIREKNFFQDTEYYLLEDIFSEASAALIGFLLSGKSISRMYKIKNEVLKNRYNKKKTLLN